MNRRRIVLVAVAVLLAILVIGAGAFVLWANDAAQPTPAALAALQSDATVQVTNQNGWLVFQPASNSGAPPSTGLILYPGGKVDYRAYAPVAREIAAQGYLVVIPPMPLNLAFFGSNVASSIMAAFPQVENWAIGGHSLG